jgi:NADH-quinone oxidoreductase subunit C
MSGEDFLTRIQGKFGNGVVSTNLDVIDPWIVVTSDALPDVCRYLRDEPDLQFNMLNCITAVDYFEPDEKKAAKVKWGEPRIEVVYHFSSISKKHTIVLKVNLPRWKDDQEGKLPELPSVSGIYSTADWHEREVYDLSGVFFTDHPNLIRILCPEDWVGYPLRKDYEMPLEYHGIRGK